MKMSDMELLLTRLGRLAIVLDDLMPRCAKLVRDAVTMLKNQQHEIWELQEQIEYITDKQIKKDRRSLDENL